MYLVHHKKDGVYANISFSVYPEGPSMVDLRLDPSRLILNPLGPGGVLTCSDLSFVLFSDTCDIFMAKVLLYCIQHKLCYNNMSAACM